MGPAGPARGGGLIDEPVDQRLLAAGLIQASLGAELLQLERPQLPQLAPPLLLVKGRRPFRLSVTAIPRVGCRKAQDQSPVSGGAALQT